MIFLYNSDRSTSKNNYILKHFGSTTASAAERIEGMFAHQNTCSMNTDFSVCVHARNGRVISSKTLEEHLTDFSNYASTFSISEYTCEAKRSLRLNDLWDDDPIGSAGSNVVDFTQLTSAELNEINSIFTPFTGVIYPDQIYKYLSIDDIKKIKRRYSNNQIFSDELRKRKGRSLAVGEDFTHAQYQEIVWIDLTLQLRTWALGRGYDSFVYANNREGKGEDAYVTLLSNQVKKTDKKLNFLKEKYMNEMPSIIRNMINNHKKYSNGVAYHVLWGQQDPMVYWE
jgi:hypothetical protein